jgi:hypothetical protein
VGTVAEHLKHFRELLQQGVEADLGCAALIETALQAEYDEDGMQWSTAVVHEGTPIPAEAPRDPSWAYKDGALQTDYEHARALLNRVALTSEVHLLTKHSSSGSTERIFVGRGKQNDVILRDVRVSSIHLQLQPMDDDRMVAIDCRSSNGTYVNGQRLEPNKQVILQSGDYVRLSQCAFYFLGRNSLRMFLKLWLAASLTESAAGAISEPPAADSPPDKDIVGP